MAGKGENPHQRHRRAEKALAEKKKRIAEKKKANAPKEEPKTLESKRIFDPEQIMDEETLMQMDSTDEFAKFFVEGQTPKILVTTTRRPCAMTHELAEELRDLFPTAEYRPRPSHYLFRDVVQAANDRAFTHLIVVNESRKRLDKMSIVKLPEGPTAIFQLSSIRLGKEIHNHGRSTAHTPELILNNFVTKLGHRVGRLLVSMFPHVPEFTGRQVVTFHNQRDFIFVRRHRYLFDDNGERVNMQEIGPQFTLKLHKIIKATANLKDAPVEYEWKPHAVENKKFSL